MSSFDTFYYHYRIGFPESWSVNLPFLCVRCGNCCTLAAFNSAGFDLIGNPTEQQVQDVNQQIKTYIEANRQKIDCSKDLTDIKCPFLLQDNSCEIYPYRPVGCQLYPKTDCGMSTEEGLCESLDRFKNLRKAITKGYGGNYIADSYFLGKDGIKSVKMTKTQYERCVAKLRRAGMTQNELLLFQHLNGH